jgi:hypothetical protein
VRKLFGDRVDRLDMTRGEYVERAARPRAYVDLFMRTFGPLIATRGLLAEDPDPDGPAEYSYEYLLAVARKR